VIVEKLLHMRDLVSVLGVSSMVRILAVEIATQVLSTIMDDE
jgi:hypothetical protein